MISKATVITVGTVASALIAALTLQSEVSIRLDSLVVTEAEAADFADQHKIDRLRARMDVLRLQLKHAATPNETRAIEAELMLTARQLNYVLCITDPRTDPRQCVP